MVVRVTVREICLIFRISIAEFDTFRRDPELVKRTYRKLAKEYHPDNSTGSQEMFARLENAYEAILKGDYITPEQEAAQKKAAEEKKRQEEQRRKEEERRRAEKRRQEDAEREAAKKRAQNAKDAKRTGNSSADYTYEKNNDTEQRRKSQYQGQYQQDTYSSYDTFNEQYKKEFDAFKEYVKKRKRTEFLNRLILPFKLLMYFVVWLVLNFAAFIFSFAICCITVYSIYVAVSYFIFESCIKEKLIRWAIIFVLTLFAAVPFSKLLDMKDAILHKLYIWTFGKPF